MDEEAADGGKSRGGKGESAEERRFTRVIGRRASQIMRARIQAKHPVWAGLGLMGMVGWSVAVPTVIGVFLGQWLDANHPGSRSWTLALLAAGLVVGCVNAWRWVSKENAFNRDIRRDDGQDAGKETK
jgi:ATP synthase protein I